MDPFWKLTLNPGLEASYVRVASDFDCRRRCWGNSINCSLLLLLPQVDTRVTGPLGCIVIITLVIFFLTRLIEGPVLLQQILESLRTNYFVPYEAK